MACNVELARKTFKRSIKRAEALSKTMSITKEGEVLSETKAVAERALALLNENDYAGLNDLAKKEFAHDLATVTAKAQLGDIFSAAIRKHPTNKSERTDFILKSAKHRYSESVGDIVELTVTPKGSNKQYTYSFINGSSVSRKSSTNGNSIFIPQMYNVFASVTDMVTGVDASLTRVQKAESARKALDKMRAILDSDKTTEELLGSAANFDRKVFDYKKAGEKVKYRHGSKEDMKNMLADLHAIGGRTISNDHYRYYDELLDAMHEPFFRKMNLYINENEDDNLGWVDIDKNHILLNTSQRTDVGMSNTEVYMHEVIHTMTRWALKGNTAHAIRLRERLNFLRGQAFKNITWQDLKRTDSRLSDNGAKERFEYIFDSDNANDEFLAFALTNPGFMALLDKVKLKDTRKPGIFNAIRDFFSDIMNSIMGNHKFSQRNSDVKKEIHTLAFMLAEINNSAEQGLKENKNLFVIITDIVDSAEGKYEEILSAALSYLAGKGGKPVKTEGMGHTQKVFTIAKFFLKSIYDPNFRHSAGAYFSSMGVSARSSVREIARSVLPPILEHITMEIEMLGLKGSSVDRARNTRVMNTAASIVDKFRHTLTDKEQVALTSIILEANGSTLFTNDKNMGKGYSDAQLVKLIGDFGYREKIIHSLKRRIIKKSSSRSNWIIAQAKGLGIFMSTGKGHKVQNTNSSNIVRGYLTSERFKVDEELLSMVEELASLTAIGLQGSFNTLAVASLLTSENNGVKNVVNLYEAFKSNSKSKLFEDDDSHVMEGYIRELFDDSIETIYAVMSEREELEKSGFVLKSVFGTKDNALSGAEAVGFFVSDANARPERLSGAVGLGNPNSRGMSLKDVRYAQFHDSKKHAQVWFEADKAEYNADAIEINKQLVSGVPVEDIEEGPVPILDATGNVVDYRNMMNKKDKAKHLKQNRKVTDVLSKTAGSVIDKVMRGEQNEAALKLVEANLKDVYDNLKSKDNLLEYTLIGPDHVDPEIRKLFHQLPKSFQKLANNRADKVLPIPTMLMDLYFGYSQGRLTDFPGADKLPGVIKRIINIVEKIWVDLVKIVKGNILLKIPAVIITNIVSNIIYGFNTGIGPIEIFGAYKKSFIDVHNFMQKHKNSESKKVELLSLTEQYNTTRFKNKAELDSYNDEVARLTSEINRLEKEMGESEVKELFDLGMYQAVIEDVNMYKLGDTNVISDTADKYLSKLPTLIKTPIQWLYLSKETKWYQANQYLLQMSDLVARDVMNKKQKLIEKSQVAGKKDLPLWYRKHIGNLDRKRAVLSEEETKTFLALSEKSRHANLLKFFINYNLPNGKGEEFLNRYGVLMFTKYVKRIQNVIADSTLRHPIRGTVAILAASFAFVDVETIQDQSFLVKAGDDYGVLGLTPIYSPPDIIEMAFTPPLINLGRIVFGTP